MSDLVIDTLEAVGTRGRLNVIVYLSDLNGVEVTGFTTLGVELAILTARTDADGHLTLDVYPNADVDRPNTYWTVLVGGDSFLILKSGSSQTLQAAIVVDPDELGPAGASLAALNAEIVARTAADVALQADIDAIAGGVTQQELDDAIAANSDGDRGYADAGDFTTIGLVEAYADSLAPNYDPAGAAAAAQAAAVQRANHTGSQLAATVSDFAAAAVAATAGTYQPTDADLTAIAALSTTAYGRAFLALADASAGRTALGLGTAATQASSAFDAAGLAAAAQAASQPVDSDLIAIAALSTTAFGRSVLALADAAALRTLAGLGSAAVAATGDFDPSGAAATARTNAATDAAVLYLPDTTSKHASVSAMKQWTGMFGALQGLGLGKPTVVVMGDSIVEFTGFHDFRDRIQAECNEFVGGLWDSADNLTGSWANGSSAATSVGPTGHSKVYTIGTGPGARSYPGTTGLDVYFTGTMDITYNGATTAGVVLAAGERWRSPRTAGLATNVVTLVASGGSATAHGIQTYAGNHTNGVNVYEWGHLGWKVTDFTTTNVAWKTFAARIMPDAVIIQLGVNDKIAGDSAATYQANLTALIAAWRVVNPKISVVLMTNYGTTSANNLDDYNVVKRALARSLNTAVIDLNTVIGATVAWSSQGHGNAGATETFDVTTNNAHTVTLDANCTFTLTGAVAGTGSELYIDITQNGTGGWTITWPSSVQDPPTVSTTALANTRVYLYTADGGATWVRSFQNTIDGGHPSEPVKSVIAEIGMELFAGNTGRRQALGATLRRSGFAALKSDGVTELAVLGSLVDAIGTLNLTHSSFPTDPFLLTPSGTLTGRASVSKNIQSTIVPDADDDYTRWATVRGSTRNLLAPAGAFAETFPRQGFAVGNVVIPIASGTLELCAVKLLVGDVVTNITFSSRTTAAITPTNWWFCLCDSALLVLKITADQTSTAWAANTAKTLALSSTYTVTTSGIYYIGIMMAAATIISTEGVAGASNQRIGIAPVLVRASTTGLTTPASLGVGNTAVAGAASGVGTPYAYVS